MKNKILLVVMCLGYALYAQVNNRVDIMGQIIVEGNDLEDITIYNKTLKRGTLSDADGNFVIKARVNDTLEVRALQYQDFDVIVNETSVQSRRLRIFLIEEITQLDEIILKDKELSGQLNSDVLKIKTFTPKLDALYYSVKSKETSMESPSAFSRSDIEIARLTSQNKPLVNGLNIVNIVDQLLLPLFRSEARDKKTNGIPEVPMESIKYYFGTEFLHDNFDIPKDRVAEFVRYVQDENFDYALLNYGKELEFLELLNQRSKAFLESTKSTD